MLPINLHLLSFRQLLKFVFVLALIGIALLYVYYQSRNLISGPQIALSLEPEKIQYDQTIRIEGQAKNITALTVNGRRIFTDEQGIFSYPLVLEKGYTIMTLTAQDRYGRMRTVTREFVYVRENS